MDNNLPDPTPPPPAPVEDHRDWIAFLREISNESIYITDDRGHLVFASQSFAAGLGYTSEEILRLPLALWEEPGTRDETPPPLEKIRILALLPTSILTTETHYRKKDGTLVPVEIHSRPIVRNGSRYALHSVRNTSLRAAAEHEQKTLAGYNRLLIEANRTLLTASDELSLYKTLCRLSSSLEGISLAWVGAPGEDGYFRIFASNGQTGWLDSVRIPSDPVATGITSAPYQAWKDGEPVFNLAFDDTLAGERSSFAQHVRRAIRKFGFKSLAALPITGLDGKRIVLTLYHTAPSAFDLPLQEVLTEISQDLSRGLERLQILRSRKEALNLKNALLDNALSGILMVRDRTIMTVNARLLEMLGYDSPDELEGKSSRILYADDEEFLRVGSMIYPAAFREGRVVVNDVRGRKRSGEILFADFSATSANIGGEEILVATIHDSTERHLHARALERLVSVNALHARANVILTTVEEEKRLLKDLCDLAVAQAGVKLAWIGQADPGGEIEFLAAAGVTDFLREARISVDSHLPNGQGPAGRAFREARPVFDEFFSHPSWEAPWQERARRYGLESLAVLPILHKGRLWGLFALYYGERQVFEASVRSVLEDLAQSVSRGLDRIDLRSSERRTSALNAAILEASALGVILTRGPIVRFANGRIEDLLHLPGPFEGQNLLDLLGNPAEPAGIGERILVPSRLRERVLMEVPIGIPGSGDTKCIEMSGVPFSQEGFDTLWTLSDITLKKKAREGEALLARALVAVHEGVIITDSQRRIIYTNEAFTTITGYRHDEAVGQDCRFLQGENSDRETVDSIRRALDSGQTFRGQILNYRKDGSPFWNLLTLSPVRNPEGAITHFVGVQNDITEFRNLLEQNSRLAFTTQHDPLTGLLNRSALDDHLLRLVARKNRQGGSFTLGILDLDDFKPVNDTFGHAAGDTLLQEIARRLSETIRSHDLIARIGGDEFALVVEDIGTPNAPEFQAFLDRLRRIVETPFEVVSGRLTHIGLSLGLALYPSDALDPESLLREADRALCFIKERKHSRERWWHFAGEPETGVSSRETDPYGEGAKALLEKYAEAIAPAVDRFVDAFYGKLDSLPEARVILEALGEEERQTLALRQSEHLRFLLSPRTTREAILSRARIVGEIHCLSGVYNSLLVTGMNLYRKLLSSQIHRGIVPDRDRVKILAAADYRIEDHIRTELEAEISTVGRYMESTFADLPVPPSQDACPEIDLLGDLPGVLSAFYLSCSPSLQGDCLLASSGAQRESLRSIFAEAYSAEVLSSLMEIQTRSLSDPALPEPFRQMSQANVRALLEIPIQSVDRGINGSNDTAPVVDHWLVIAGSHPNQFDSSWARQFAQSLRQRIEKRLQGDMRDSGGLPPETREAYRRELRQGGLSMYMQPVVDLRTKALSKVEALARLTRPDGQTVMPNRFLPALTDTDLDWLFREGLSQSLAHLAAWDRSGLVVDVSVNIAPTTLVNPLCGQWVSTALSAQGILPSRLTLEILENQTLANSPEHREAINRLLALGIKLSMDDMGVGYSNLQRLASLPFDKIKIDQSLLAHIRINPLETLGIIGAIVQMGQELEHGIVVEGLEDEGMTEAAMILGIQYGQGFSLARPMPADQIVLWNSVREKQLSQAGISSWLGALASSWIHLHHAPSRLPHLSKCPLTVFLSRHGNDEFRHRHEELHAGIRMQEAGKDLSSWLAQQVKAEGARIFRGE